MKTTSSKREWRMPPLDEIIGNILLGVILLFAGGFLLTAIIMIGSAFIGYWRGTLIVVGCVLLALPILYFIGKKAEKIMTS